MKPSVILDEVADFFELNPKAYTSEDTAMRNGMRCGYLSPDADQWDVIGAIGRILWNKYNVRTDLGNLWFFKRIVKAIDLGVPVSAPPYEPPILVWELYKADTVFDIIEGLRRAAQYARDENYDRELDLTPLEPQPEIKQYRLYI